MIDALQAERDEVERAAAHYYGSALQQGIDARSKRLVTERCLPFVHGRVALDLGFVDGNWTDVLLDRGMEVDVVEGASDHVALSHTRYADNSRVRVFHSLFQAFTPDRQYDTIVAGDMLRYLPDDGMFLEQLRGWLAPGGRLVVTVPNSRSMHRRVGALMGMEGSPEQANARDREVGNRRSYDRYTLRDVLRRSGFTVQVLHGCLLKPLSSAQMQGWSDDLLRAFLAMGDELEDYAWFLYAVAVVPAEPAP